MPKAKQKLANIDDLRQTLATQRAQIDAQIEELSAEREAKEDEIQRERALWTKHLNNMMAAKDETIRKQDETIRSKDEAIQAMRDEVKWLANSSRHVDLAPSECQTRATNTDSTVSASGHLEDTPFYQDLASAADLN